MAELVVPYRAARVDTIHVLVKSGCAEGIIPKRVTVSDMDVLLNNVLN